MKKYGIDVLEDTPLIKHCGRCGTHVDLLKPFDAEYHDGHFRGAKIVQNYRKMNDIEPIPVLDEILAMYEDSGLEEVVAKYDGELIETAFYYQRLINQMANCWECKDCILEVGTYKIKGLIE